MVSEPATTQAFKERQSIRKQHRFRRRASEFPSVETQPQRATLLIFRTKRFRAAHPNDDESLLMLSMEAIEDEW